VTVRGGRRGQEPTLAEERHLVVVDVVAHDPATTDLEELHVRQDEGSASWRNLTLGLQRRIDDVQPPSQVMASGD
jgi:hypothetical protein